MHIPDLIYKNTTVIDIKKIIFFMSYGKSSISAYFLRLQITVPKKVSQLAIFFARRGEMTYKDSYPSYFDDALRIHAICADSGMGENDARLLTYMHAKASEKSTGIDYFYSPEREDADALEIMLGKSKKKIDLPPIVDLNKNEQDALEIILTIADRISKLDTMLAQECGMENRLSGELSIRLRLYKDASFRNKMISIYKNSILPMLTIYDEEKISTAFFKLQEDRRKKEVELLELTGLNDQNS